MVAGIFKKQNTSHMIVDYILDKIQKKELKIGDKLMTEREFSEQMGVSRIPLREAICALSVLGVLESRQGGGTYVCHYDPKILGRIYYAFAILDDTPLHEIVAVRKILEAEAVKIASIYSTSEELEKIELWAVRYGEALAIDPEDMNFKVNISRCDYEFHKAIAEAAHNKFLLQMLTTVMISQQELMDKSFEEVETGLLQLKEFDHLHKKIVEAIKNHNSDLAYSFMYQHTDIIQTLI